MSKITRSSISYSGDIQYISKLANAKDSFIKICNGLIADSYFDLIKIEYSLFWEEETFTANLKRLLEHIIKKNRLSYFVARENLQDNKKILTGVLKAKSAKKIDIYFASFHSNQKLSYAIEAKILVENNSGTRNSSYLNAEYIDEGMDRFLKGIYKIKGCMLGYVIQGDPDNVILKINKLLSTRERNTDIIGNKHSINKFNYCYTSSHSKMDLVHFLMPLILT